MQPSKPSLVPTVLAYNKSKYFMSKSFRELHQQYPNICVLPFMHAEVSFSSGVVQACCKASKTMREVNVPLSQIWNNANFTDMRNLANNGKLGPECQPCKVKEGSFSYRQMKNTVFEKHLCSMPPMWKDADHLSR